MLNSFLCVRLLGRADLRCMGTWLMGDTIEELLAGAIIELLRLWITPADFKLLSIVS